jgi:hypothetical protein
LRVPRADVHVEWMSAARREFAEEVVADSKRLRQAKERIVLLVAAWEEKRPLEIEITPMWRYCSTDGWAIFDGADCIVSRLPFTEMVAISDRPHRRFTRYLIQAIASELEARRIATVRLVPPSASSVATPNELARAWRILQEPPLPSRSQPT